MLKDLLTTIRDAQKMFSPVNEQTHLFPHGNRLEARDAGST